ncbi:MFS transporter TsgA [uncultured Alteromonas sp.]|uniref:MFS transporter TsgA n=1 Tax=uncultured Alteromonas sp. TaxID=179113 RepID=UPI0025FFECB5|nr:MFS transporter TsgA [uncultured Alteromonas sp.]
MNTQVRLTLIAFLSYMIMSGLLTQAGVILNAIAAQLEMTAAQAVSIFSWLTGGALIGTLMSMYLYTRFSLRRLLIITYLFLLILGVVLPLLTDAGYPLLAAVFLGLGVCCGCGLSGGAVIISRIYRAQRRASAFIATDCAFSAAGFIFPTLAGWLLVKELDWTLSYLAVASLAVIILILAVTTVFPDVHRAVSSESAGQKETALAQFKRILTPRVVCFAVGVCLYLIAQTTFLTWAPNYLMAYFDARQEVAGQVVGNYWGFSIFGLLTSVVLVNFIPTRLMLLVVSGIAITCTTLFLLIDSVAAFLTLGLAFGLLTTCIYKIAISVGTQQIADSPPMLVTLMLFSGSIGSTLAPVISGWVVESSDEKGALMLALAGFIMMLVLFIVAMVLERKAKRQTLPDPVQPESV